MIQQECALEVVVPTDNTLPITFTAAGSDGPKHVRQEEEEPDSECPDKIV